MPLFTSHLQKYEQLRIKILGDCYYCIRFVIIVSFFPAKNDLNIFFEIVSVGRQSSGKITLWVEQGSKILISFCDNEFPNQQQLCVFMGLSMVKAIK